MNHLGSRAAGVHRLVGLAAAATPLTALAQSSSPFMTGANALQTNILAWLTPIAVILVMVLGALAMANRVESAYAAKLRRAYGERVAQRAERAAQPAAHDLEEVRRRARTAWLELRAREPAAATQEAVPERAREDDDLAR
jgi:choline-glycine betaine transporter